MDIGEIVRKIVKRYSSRDPYEIAKSMNVILVFCPLIDVRGFYQHFQRNNIIYIDETLPRNEQLFVCAHELGHMLLHKKTNFIYMDAKTHLNTNRYEIEANKFAIELLISDDIFIENRDYTLDQLSILTGYSENLIELKMKNYI